MAYTDLASLVTGAENVFNDYVIARVMEKSAFFKSGVVTPTAALVPSKGAFTHFPYWDEMSGDDEVLTDNGSLTVNPLTTGEQVAAILARGKAFGVNDLATLVSGTEDPLRQLANLVGDYWVRMYDRAVINAVDGSAAGIDATSVGSIIRDISAGAGAASNIDASASYDTMQLLGENASDVSTVIMHSATYNWLNKQDLINIDFPVSGSQPIQTYLGRSVVVDDRVTSPAADTYHTYFCKSGAVGFADGTPSDIAVEFDRDILAGNKLMTTRRRFVLHPQGASFTGAAVANTLGYTNAELANASNWDTGFTDLNKYGIRVLKHTIDAA